MQDLMYLLKTGGDATDGVAKKLGTKKAPSHVRVGVLAPLSNYGYPPGSEGSVLGIGGDGLTIGVDGMKDGPRMFVPWQNVSYMADGAKYAAAMGGAKK